ncbi:MAG: four helix bundle protein [Patescibacteria group bacterium]|jgi:four helix bundle protein
MASKSFRDLIVWKKSFELTKEIYRLTKSFPKDEIFGITSQIKRAAVSIPSNIAEGCERGYRQELLRFLLIALGSAGELATQLLLAKDLKMAEEKSFINSEQLLLETTKLLHCFIRKLKS